MLRTQPESAEPAEPGQQLRRTRERLRLKYRDVEEASAKIAGSRGDDQFQVGLSRLADIENRGTVPSIYRIYSLCAIYRLDFHTVLTWYGVDLDDLVQETASIQLETTNLLSTSTVEYPFIRTPLLREETDISSTFYLTRQMVQWGRVPLAMLEGLDIEHHRYAFIGLDDKFMYPIIRPGSFVQIDDSRRKISTGGWANEWDRPIYLVEHRDGYRCAWCNIQGDTLILQPHPASAAVPETYRLPEGAEIVGQVIAVATRLHPGTRHHTRFSANQE